MTVAAAGLVLSACGTSPASGGTPIANKPNAQELTRDMVKKEQDVKSAAMHGSIDLRVDDQQTKDNVKATIALGTKSDMRNDADQRFSMSLKGDLDGTMNGSAIKGGMDLDLVLVVKDIFVRLNKLESPEIDQSPFGGAVKKISGKWYIFKDAVEQAKSLAKEQAQGASFQGLADGLAGDNATPAQKQQMRDLVARTNFFESSVDDTTASVDGTDTYKVAVKLNKPEIVNFAKESAKIRGQEMSADEVRNMEKGLGEVDFQGTLYIGVQDHLLYRAAGTVTPVPGSDAAKNGNFLVNFDATFSGYNQDQKITAPANAEPFDLQKVLGADGAAQ